MPCYILIILLFVVQSISVQGQPSASGRREVTSSDRREKGLTLGVNYSRHLFAEAGYFRSYVYEMGGFAINSTTLSFGSEFSYSNRVIVAPKVEARVQLYFLIASIAPIVYTDFSESALKLRPEIGLGLYNCGLTYGYNVGVINNDFKGLNKHLFSLKCYIVKSRKAGSEYDRRGKRMP